MGLSLEGKELIVSQLSERLASAQAVLFAEHVGARAAMITALRKNARENGVYLKVIRNTLIRRAISGTSFDILSDKISGPLIYAIGEDPVATAKVLYKFSNNMTHQAFVLRGGSVLGRYIDPEGVKVLATLPSRENLLAKLVGTMQAPIVQLIRVMHEVPSKFVRVLSAVRDSRESSFF